MGPSIDSDDECFTEQLDGSDSSPRAQRTILRQTFTMRRRHNVEHDCRLTNLTEVIQQPVDDVARGSTSSSTVADKANESIIALLEPHTSSPDLRIIARILADLITGNVNHDDELLNDELDILAIAPQAKQGIIPALMEIMNMTEVRAQGSTTIRQPQIQRVSASCPDGGVSVDTDTHPMPMGSTVHYETGERRFTSKSGSGKTTWYLSKSNTNIPSPPAVPQAETGHLYVHLDYSTGNHQYWMFGTNNEWQRVSKRSEYPLNHDRVLAIRDNGEPSWVTRASSSTVQGRKEKEIRGRSMHA